MKKELTPLEYYTPKLNDYQIEEFKRLMEDKSSFLNKNRRKL